MNKVYKKLRQSGLEGWAAAQNPRGARPSLEAIRRCLSPFTS